MTKLLQLIKSYKTIHNIARYLKKYYHVNTVTVYGIAKTYFRYNIIQHTIYCIEEKESYLLLGLINNVLYLIRILKTDPSVGFVVV